MTPIMSRVFALAATLTLGLVAQAEAQSSNMAPPTDPYFVKSGSWGQKYADQWALQRVGFDASPTSAWRLVKRDAQPVIVAMVDTGLDWNHLDISTANLWKNPGARSATDPVLGWDFYDNDNKPWDYDGHGTFVAGIIAATQNNGAGIAGVNPLARLMVLKAVNNFGHSRASYIAQAIAFAADHGARVVNLSVGGKGITRVEQAAVDYAYAKGVVLVVAAGNDGVNVNDYGIAGNDKVLTVAATGFDDQRVIFSNWGNVSVAAPGLDVLSLRARRTDTMLGIEGVTYKAGSAYVGADKRYYRASGTSFSAPFVTGLASLMIANNPSLTNRQVIDIIKSTARDVGTPGVDQYTGYGIIDAKAALAAAPDFRLLAGISKVEVQQNNGAASVRVFGMADADALKSAHIEVGAGENPTSWTQAGAATASTDANGVLADIPAETFRGSSIWQIRLVVEHKNGTTREARFRLNVG